MTRLTADFLLFLAAAIWGAAFIAQKVGNTSMGPVLFCGLRFLIAAAALLPFAVFEASRTRKKAGKPLGKRDVILAVLVGLCLLFGITLQQTALVTVSASAGGFLTALYLVLVPFAAWLLQGIRPRPLILVACLICLLGAWLLAGADGGGSWQRGDTLLICADVVWSFQIVLISKFLATQARPFFLSVIQYAVTGILATAVGLLFEPHLLDGVRSALPSLLYAGVLGGGLAFTFQIIGQRHTPASESALIMSLEGAFAAAAGAVFLSERLTVMGVIGCVLIMGGILLVELGPLLSRRKAPS